jgi:hypothetical protein
LAGISQAAVIVVAVGEQPVVFEVLVVVHVITSPEDVAERHSTL